MVKKSLTMYVCEIRRALLSGCSAPGTLPAPNYIHVQEILFELSTLSNQGCSKQKKGGCHEDQDQSACREAGGKP